MIFKKLAQTLGLAKKDVRAAAATCPDQDTIHIEMFTILLSILQSWTCQTLKSWDIKMSSSRAWMVYTLKKLKFVEY